MGEHKTGRRPVLTPSCKAHTEAGKPVRIFYCSLDEGHAGPFHVALNKGYQGDQRIWIYRWSVEPVLLEGQEQAAATILHEHRLVPAS